MRVTKYTDDKLRLRIKYLFSLATEKRLRAENYLHEHRNDEDYKHKNDEYEAIKEEARKVVIEARDLIDSGQIPWVEAHGGNDCDARGRTPEVIARRIFDTFTAKNDLSDFGGRAIELAVKVSGNFGSRQYTLMFHNPATVKTVIEQLQQELDGWDDWDGVGYEF